MLRIGVVGLPGRWSTERLADALEKRTGFRQVLSMDRLRFDLQAQRVYHEELDLADLDGLVVKKLGNEYAPYLLERLELLRFLNEKRGVPVFSKPSVIARMISRLGCSTMLRMGEIPMPPTLVTEDPKQAADAVTGYGKAVLKPLFTSKSRGMRVIEAGPDHLEKIEAFQKEGNRLMYIQKIVEHQGQDLGVCFLGGRYIETYARVGRPNFWNTTTASGGRYEPCRPSLQVLDVAERAQSLVGLDFTCVDVVETPEGPEVFEVSAFGGFRGLWESHRIDLAEKYAEYVVGKLDHER